MKASYSYQLLRGDGIPDGPLRHVNYRELRVIVAFACPRYTLSMLNHMLAIAHCNPRHPVELVLWNIHGTCLEYQARVHFCPTDAVITDIG